MQSNIGLGVEKAWIDGRITVVLSGLWPAVQAEEFFASCHEKLRASILR